MDKFKRLTSVKYLRIDDTLVCLVNDETACKVYL